MNKIKNIFITFSIIFMASCEENTTTVCNVANPLEQLAFLKEAKNIIDSIDCGAKSSIEQYTFNSEIVFLVNICSNITDGQTVVYNCKGEVVCKFGGVLGENTCPNFKNNATNKSLLYGED